MRNVALYMAVSLDGYIAGSGGGVDWLNGQDSGVENGDSYAAFIQGIDTVVMGWNTYHQIVTELSPEEWVYAGLTSYVITHRDLPSEGELKFVGEDPCNLVRRLKREPGKGIWICGGAGIARPLIQAGLIDVYDISIIPTLLGSGIRLWGETENEQKLRLARAESCNGITELVYTRR